MAEPVAIDFYLGLGSRYSYLAAGPVNPIEATYGCRFVGKLIAADGGGARRRWTALRDAMMSRLPRSQLALRRGRSSIRRGCRGYDARCWANFYGIPLGATVAFRVDPACFRSPVFAAGGRGRWCRCRLLQRLIFVDGTAIDAAVIATLPAQLGIDTEAFRRDLDGPQTKARHDGLLDEARARGAFGVPSLFLGVKMLWETTPGAARSGDRRKGDA